jgi:hypothetical protein
MANDDQSNLQVTNATNLASSPPQILCHRCKTPNYQDAQYCKYCGDLLGERQCTQCSKQNDRSAKYCKQCGEQLQTLYTRFGPRAEKIKIILQMSVGFILTGFIIVYIAIYALEFIITHKSQNPLTDVSILTIVGVALAISTAFELAYTLFPDGPDEAVNPVITGIAAGILLLISPRLDFTGAGAIAVLIFVMVVLFILKEFFIEDKDWIDRIKRKPLSETINQNNNTNDAS